MVQFVAGAVYGVIPREGQQVAAPVVGKVFHGDGLEEKRRLWTSRTSS